MAANEFDIIVLGAGLIGSALALTLARTSANNNVPLKIAVVERAPQILLNHMPNQRVIALGKVATNILSNVGVFEQLGTGFAYPYKRMFIWDENSNGELVFDTEQHELNRLGYMVDSVQCTMLLQQKVLEERCITPFFETQAQEFVRDEKTQTAQLKLKDRVLSAPLIIAADGARSWLRHKVKIFANHQSYHQHGIVAKIKTEQSHQDTAWQRFLATGPLAFLPVEQNQSSIVWSVDSEQAEQLMSLNDNEFEQRLTEAFDYKLGNVLLLTKRLSFPLISQQAESYFVRNVALVGDAAHSIHPLAGQGANLGFKDIDALAAIIGKQSITSLADPVLLQQYQRKRKTDNQQTDMMMSGLLKAYQGDQSLWLSLRGIGMNMVNRSNALKSLLIKQAAGY